MTRDDAIAQVLKLEALAANPGTPAEAEAAKSAAANLRLKHGLTDADFTRTREVAAFDELVEKLRTYTAGQRSIPPVVVDVIANLKTTASTVEKAVALRKAVQGVRLIDMIPAFLVGEETKQLKKIVDEVLAKHRIVI